MKILNFGFLVILIFISKSAFSQYAEIAIATISEEKKEAAYNFAHQFFTSCEETPKINSKNTTSKFRKYTPENKVKYHCNWQEERYGMLEGMQLQSVILRNELEVFRYKVKRSKTNWDSEIRLFVDKKGKYASIATKSYWSDTYYHFRENPKKFPVDIKLLNDSIIAQNKQFVFQSYNKCEASKIFDANETNTIYRSIRKDWKKEMLAACNSVKNKNGDFKNLELVEFITDSVSTNIYRYKVDFDKLEKPSEIRIYSKNNDKYMGVFVIDLWNDSYLSLKKANEKSKNELGI